MEQKEIAAQDDLLMVLDLLDRAKMKYWLDGGWGVDVLAGKQGRIVISTSILMPAMQISS